MKEKLQQVVSLQLHSNYRKVCIFGGLTTLNYTGEIATLNKAIVVNVISIPTSNAYNLYLLIENL